MKAITILQPWASLIACGAKHYETRSWKTNYRGPIAIHAGLKKPPEQGDIPFEVFNAITSELARYYGAWRNDWHLGGTINFPDGTENGIDIPLGFVIATADLVDCLEVVGHQSLTGAAILENGKLILGNELCFGDYSNGRYAWQLENVEMLKEPIPAKGQQGLWNFNYDDTQK